LRPPIEPSVAPQLTLTAGVAVAELLSHYCPDDVTLKWPNDIQVKRKKICGILTEMRTLGVTIDYVIVGIGININMTKEEFQEDFREISTSLKEELGSAMSRTQFAILLYKCFEKWYTLYERNGFEFVRDAWLRYSGILGKYIRVNDRESFQHGEVLGIDEYGALLIFDDEKKLKRILSGDVTLIGD
jgi:BirA family biotin operon repressor/biotin-[acetyl-CoA-carboxylase] ligase